MQRLAGPVAGLEWTRHELGRQRPGRTPQAVHVYRFRIGDQRLELRHGAALPLNEGDQVVVVHGGRRRPPRVYAWANRTWGATLVEPPGVAAAMRGWLPAIPSAGLFLLAPVLPTAGALVAGLAGAACLVLAGRGFLEYARYRRAARLLDA